MVKNPHYFVDKKSSPYKGKTINKFVSKFKSLSNKEKSETAFSLHQQFVESLKKENSLVLQQAALACFLVASGAYKYILGDEKASFRAYFAQPEIKKKWRMMVRLMHSWSVWCDQLGVPESEIEDVSIVILDRVASHVTPETKEEWLSAAKSLSLRDLEIYLREKRGIDQDTCTHEWKNLKKCNKCLAWNHEKQLS